MGSHDRSLLEDNRTRLEKHDFSFIAASPLVSHCHHCNLFFDQIIDDALGVELGQQVRVEAAYEAASQLLNAFIRDMPPTTLDDRLDIARSMFADMGLGTLDFNVSEDGGMVVGQHLHYGFNWRQQRGGSQWRTHPADAVAAGYISAAVEAAFGLPLGCVYCVEKTCIAVTDASACEFEVINSGESGEAFGVTKSDIVEVMPASFDSLREDEVGGVAMDLREFVITSGGDKRGLISSFGVFLTHQPANYYNHCVNRMLGILEQDKPGAIDVAKELLRECGHQDGYFAFGGILESAEWEALGAEVSEPEHIVNGCLSIARALSFGHWSLEAYEPGQRLIVRSPGTFESVYRKAAYPDSVAGCCYMYQGAAVAVMDLAHRVDWDAESCLSVEAYRELHASTPWQVSETHCVAAGDDMCRVVVEPR